MTARIAISGFGRIGRAVLRRVAAEETHDLEVAAVNSNRLTPDLAAHLLKYDSVYGRFPGEVGHDAEHLVVDGRRIDVLAVPDPARCPWTDLGIDVVVEATGNFTTREEAGAHLAAGARKVVVTAPTRGEDLTIVMGVNDELYDPLRHHLLSASSCTTNCLSPLLAVLDARFGIQSGLMTTIHSYTRDQELLDGTHSDPRRARAANLNMCPTTTGSAKAVDLIFPRLAGRIVGLAIRVPLPDVSLVDLSVVLQREANVASINAAFRAALFGRLKGVLDITDEPLVSSDFHGDQHSAIVDLASTREAPDGHFKVLAWYDNEAGYAARVVDLVDLVASRMGVRRAQPVAVT